MKSNRNVFFLLITVLIFSSCKKTSCCVIRSLDQALEVRSFSGTDLLDPQNPSAWTEKDIDLFYLNKGTFEKIYNPSMDLPKNFKIYKNGAAGYELKLFVSEVTDGSNSSTTLIKFGNTKPDTLKAELSRTGASVTVSNLWINSVPASRSKAFTLTK